MFSYIFFFIFLFLDRFWKRFNDIFDHVRPTAVSVLRAAPLRVREITVDLFEEVYKHVSKYWFYLRDRGRNYSKEAKVWGF
jgi:hypothetical protein